MINVEVKLKSNRLQRIEERKMNKRERKAKKKQTEEKVDLSLSGYIKKDVFIFEEKDPTKTKALET